MDKININYNEKLLEDKKIFDSFAKELDKLYPKQVTFNLSKKNSFDLYLILIQLRLASYQPRLYCV